MDAPATRAAANSGSAKMRHSAAKKTRNRKKKGRGAAPAPPVVTAPMKTPPSSPEAMEEVESVSSRSVAGSNSTTRRSFSPLSGSSQRYSSEEEEDYEEDEYSSESEDEGESSYKPGGYHRVVIGEVYNSRFEVLEKLGWGHFSTVWKCLDRQTGAMVAMKVQKSARHYTEAAKDEIELLECTVHAARTEYESTEEKEEIKVIRLIDSFEHKGPNGVHVCMVFEMMGDNLLTLIKYYNYRGVPVQLVQRLTRDMMEGLAFLHDKCEIIHTDLKPENVLLSHHIPQLPKIRKSQWEAFRAMRLAQRQKGAKTPRNGGKDCNNQTGGTTSGAHRSEMSKEEKKRLKNRLKKKRQKQRKQGGVADREVSVDGDTGNGKMDSTAHPTLTTSDSSVNQLSNNFSQLVVSTDANKRRPIDDSFRSNFAGHADVAAKHDTSVSSNATRAWYHQAGQIGDEEDKDWVHLPPEFAARVMLLLPEGRVAGSKRKEREFTLSVAKSSIESANGHEEDEDVETSFVFRYLDHVDDDVISSIEEQILRLLEGNMPGQANISTNVKYRVWRLEFDARYTHAVLDYLERRVEGLHFLKLANSSGLALPGFFIPKPPSNEHVKSAAKTKYDNNDDVPDIVLQGINLLPLVESGDVKDLEVKPLQQRLGCWAARFNNLANSKMFNHMKLDAKICDLGNACWTTKHFTNDIQTRQYRCPEVILGKRYDTSADIWSMACFVFELLTGDLLFDPKSGRNFNRDEDHLAQMIELLGRMPKSFTGSQRGLREFFNRKGDLKRIRNLKFWSLQQVLIEKYHFLRHDAECLASFLGPMLRYDPSKRATAEECLAHPWLAHVDDGMDDELVDSKKGCEYE